MLDNTWQADGGVLVGSSLSKNQTRQAISLPDLLQVIQDWRPDEILRVIIPALKRHFQAAEVELYWVDQKNGEIVDITSMIANTWSWWLRYQNRFQLGEDLSGWIALNNTAICTGDPSNDPRSVSRSGVFKQFLGVPVHAGDGVVGVLNVVRDSDTPYTAEDEQYLQTVADLLGDQFAASEQITHFVNPTRVELADSTSDFRWFALIHDNRIIHRMYTAGIANITGVARDEFVRNPDLWYSLILDEDREQVRQAHEHLLQGSGFEREYRIRDKDGTIRWVRETAQGWYRFGVLAFIDGMVADITQYRRIENEQNRLFKLLTRNLSRWQGVQSIAASLDSLDLNQTLLTIYSALVHQAGYDRAGILLVDEADSNYLTGTWGTSYDGKLQDEHDYRIRIEEHPRLMPIVRGEVPYILRHTTRPQIPEPPGTSSNVLQHAMVPLKINEKIIGLISVDNLLSQRPIDEEDISFLELIAHHVAVAIAKARAFEQERRARAEAEIAQRKLAFLAEASVILSSSLDYETTLASVAQLAVPYLADWCAIHILEPDSSCYRMALVHADPEKSELIHDLMRRYPLSPDAASGYAKVLRTGEPDFWPDIPEWMVRRFAKNADHLRLLQSIGYRSYLSIPLKARGRILGAISFVIGTSARQFSEDDFKLAEELALRASVAVDNALLYREAQQAMQAETEARVQVESLANELNQRAGELDAVIEAIPDSVYVCDTAGIVTRVNAPVLHALDLSPAYSVKSIEEYAHLSQIRYPDGSPIDPDDLPLKRGLRGEIGTDFHSKILRDNTGEEIYLSTSYAPIRNSAGEITGAVAVSSDITELHHLMRQKDEFLSVASHELKTPLTSMKGFTQIAMRRLLKSGHAPEAEMLVQVDRQINRLSELVNDLLDVSRIQTGRLTMEPVSYNFADQVRRVAEIMQATTELHTIHLKIPEELQIRGDLNRLEQVLINLLGNAIKYSPQGGNIHVCLVEKGGEVQLSVCDEGIGIPEKDRVHLFERFHRASNVVTHKIPGFGLGLYISYEIMKAHGGRIWLEQSMTSQKGACFCIALPTDDESQA